MSLVQSKQISKLIAGQIIIGGIAFPAASSFNVTTLLTTAASTAAQGGIPVPVQAGSAITEGFVVSGNNLVDVTTTASGAKLADSSGNEIYGRLTNVGAVYTLSLFSDIAGVQTAFTLLTATNLDVMVPYIFTFEHLPFDAFIGRTMNFVSNDPASQAGRTKRELLTVTSLNTLSALTTAYLGTGTLVLVVNGVLVDNLDSPVALTATGTAVTWNATNAGYNLNTTDNVIAFYAY